MIAPDLRIAGYASLFDVPDLGRDVVMRGAFAGSLARRGPAGVRMLWQHDPGQPIGRWLSLAEDGRGLYAVGELNGAVARARELAALAGEGGVDGLSIGFRAVAATRDRGRGLRRLESIDLWEVSLVTFPMQTGARLGPRARDAPPRLDGAPALACAIRGVTRRLHPGFTTRTS